MSIPIENSTTSLGNWNATTSSEQLWNIWNAIGVGGGGVVTNDGTFAVQNTAPLPSGTNSIGFLSSPASFAYGQVSTSATSPLNLPSFTLVNGVVLTNTGSATVYIGSDSSVTTTTGYPLTAGSSVGLGVSNLSSIWWVVSASGTLSYIGS